jgi:hypothetical protein
MSGKCIAGADLDSSSARWMNFHSSNLALKSAGGNAHNTKPKIVVLVVASVAVAETRAAVIWVVVPRAAPHSLADLPHLKEYC